MGGVESLMAADAPDDRYSRTLQHDGPRRRTSVSGEVGASMAMWELVLRTRKTCGVPTPLGLPCPYVQLLALGPASTWRLGVGKRRWHLVLPRPASGLRNCRPYRDSGNSNAIRRRSGSH
jgi:hypothetical protein